MYLKITLFISLMLFSSISVAELSFFDGQYSELAVSSRALGMGNAFIAKSNDSSAVFYNPAGLGSVRSWQLHVSNVFVEWNKNWQSASSGGKIADAAGNFTEAFSIDGLRKISEGSYDSPTYSRFSINPHITSRYFSLGYLYAMKTRTQVTEGATGDLFE